MSRWLNSELPYVADEWAILPLAALVLTVSHIALAKMAVSENRGFCEELPQPLAPHKSLLVVAAVGLSAALFAAWQHVAIVLAGRTPLRF